LDAYPHTRQDLTLYVRESIKSTTFADESAESKELEQRLVSGSGGSFLWARLVISSFRSLSGPSDTLRALKETLASSITTDTQKLYEMILGRITGSQGHAALSMLRWVIYAARPLHIKELLAALKLQTGTDLNNVNISEISAGLLISSGSQVVRLVHSTVRNFLQGELGTKWDEVSCEAHETIAQTCLAALQPVSLLESLGLSDGDELAAEKAGGPTQSLLEYAQNYWIFHYGLAERGSSFLAGLLHGFLTGSLQKHGVHLRNPSTSFKVKQSNLDSRITDPGISSYVDVINIALVVGARFGFSELVKLELDMGADVNYSFGPEQLTPLNWASRAGHIDVVEILLRYGADLDIPSSTGNIPLLSAMSKGNDKIVELLLSYGAAHSLSTPAPMEELSLEAVSLEPCNLCGTTNIAYEVSNILCFNL
jgi:hypothetical protein